MILIHIDEKEIEDTIAKDSLGRCDSIITACVRIAHENGTLMDDITDLGLKVLILEPENTGDAESNVQQIDEFLSENEFTRALLESIIVEQYLRNKLDDLEE